MTTPIFSFPTPRRSPSSPSVIRTTELVVRGATSRTFRCREVGTNIPVTLRAYAQEAFPGTVITVDVLSEKVLKKGLSIDGNIRDSRIDIPALGLTPLALTCEGMSDLEETLDLWIDWGCLPYDIVENAEEEDGRPLLKRVAMDDIPSPYREVLMAGPRPIYEMEQVIPGAAPNDDWDAVSEAAELSRQGFVSESFKILEGLIARDLRCLDGYSHLGSGNFSRKHSFDKAVRYYEIGVAIGDSFLQPLWQEAPPDRRSYLLPWGLIDNRPYLRCLQGLALCRWRQNRWEDAIRLCTDLFWLDPDDRLRVSEILFQLKSRTPWSADE